jgi:hypothetical protein
MMTVEEKPDVTYSDIGGSKEQIEKVRCSPGCARMVSWTLPTLACPALMLDYLTLGSQCERN